MDCREARELLRKDRPCAGQNLADLESHLRSCSECNLVAQASEQLGSMVENEPVPSLELAELLQQVEDELSKERGASAFLRSMPTWARVGLGLLVQLLLVAIFGLVRHRIDIEVYPWQRLLGCALLFAVFTVLATWLILRPMHRPSPSRAYLWVTISGGLFGIFVMALLPPPLDVHPASLEGTGNDFVRRAAACLAYGTLTAAPASWMLGLMDRRTLWGSPLLVRVVGAGLLANLVLLLHCPLVSPMHLLVGHAAITFVFLGLGYLLSRLPHKSH